MSTVIHPGTNLPPTFTPINTPINMTAGTHNLNVSAWIHVPAPPPAPLGFRERMALRAACWIISRFVRRTA